MKLKIEINIEELRKKSLLVAMPTYGSLMNTLTAKSLLDLQALFTNYGIPLKFSFLLQESLIQRMVGAPA